MIIEYASTNLHLHAQLFKTISAARTENNSVEWTNFHFHLTVSPVSVNRFSRLFIEILTKGKHRRKKLKYYPKANTEERKRSCLAYLSKA